MTDKGIVKIKDIRRWNQKMPEELVGGRKSLRLEEILKSYVSYLNSKFSVLNSKSSVLNSKSSKMILNNVIEATFLERKNRFVGLGKIKDQLVKFHIGDTGALPNLLFAGNKILLQNLSGGKRKYNFRLIASKGILGNYVLTNSLLHSALVREYLDKQNILYKPEVSVGNSRIDFLLEGETYVEIKGCTLFKKVNNEIFGMFPDAPTTRGQKHLQELIQLRKQGINTQIWFLLSEKIDKFMPNFGIDKKFSLLFKDFLFTGGKVNFLYANLRFDGRNVELSLEKLTNVEIFSF